MKSIVRMAVGLAAAVVAGGASGRGDSPYIRVVDQDAQTIRLDVAVRTLVPSGEGPLVNLVGAIHIADSGFYDAVQAVLDVHDVVLYEGVGGEREAADEPEGGDDAAALLTERRVRFLSVLADDLRRREGQYPESERALVESAGGALRVLVAAALLDGWGEPMAIGAEKGFDIVSLGADGEPGGEGTDADVRASELAVRERDVTTGEEVGGLQSDLADALGLKFQLHGIDYSHPHWRNSDLSIGEIQRALGGEPVAEGEGRARRRDERLDPDAPDTLKAADTLFRTLSGESVLAKVSGFLLKMVGSSPSGRAMVKIMLADMLTHAEDLLAVQPGVMGELMKVLVEDRNVAVVRDLRAVLEDEPDVRSVAVFYGAGHFGDLEARICDELGYEHESTMWIPAITIDLQEAGLNATQVRFFRKMMGDTLEAQIKAMERPSDEE